MAALYWDKDEPGEEKIIDVLVCKIRKKLKPYGIDIKTHWGRGYYLPPRSGAGIAARSTARQIRAIWHRRSHERPVRNARR